MCLSTSPKFTTGLTFILISAILINMNKINNKSIIFGLEILAILAFSVIAFMPAETKAYSNGDSYWRYQANPDLNIPAPIISSINPNSTNGIQSKVTITITGNGFTPNSIIRKNNSNRVTTFIDSQHLMVDIYAGDMYNQNNFFLSVFNSDGQYSNALTFTIRNNTATTTSNTNNNPPSNINTNNNSSNNTTANDNYGGLTANALEGSNNFLPTGLLQWIFLAIIVLAIIFLWRYVFRSEDKYLSEPLKHA